jgi:hypothetical protein
MTMITDKEKIPQPDEDNWDLENGKEDCPKEKTVIWIPSVINKQKTTTAWWTNYHWTNKNGTYADDFRSCFDPKKFYEQAPENGPVTLKAFWDKDRPYGPSWVTSELVLGGVSEDDRLNQAGAYAVIAKATDFGALNPDMIFGIFTYQYGPSPSTDGRNKHREMDLLETIAKKQQGLNGNAQFALQPASNSPAPNGTNLRRFTIPQGTPTITLFMQRPLVPGSGEFDLAIFPDDMSVEACRKNLYSGQEERKYLLRWSVDTKSEYRQFVPPSKNERMHINLYVPGGNQGTADKDKHQEITITRFEYDKI